MLMDIRQDWTQSEIDALLESGNERIERVDGTLLVQWQSAMMKHPLVQFAVLPDGVTAGDAEYVIEFSESPYLTMLPFRAARVALVGRCDLPKEEMEIVTVGDKDIARVVITADYPMLKMTSDDREAIGVIRDSRGNRRYLALSEWAVDLIKRQRVVATQNAVIVAMPYNDAFVQRAKALGGRWRPAEKVWVFPAQREDEARRLVQEVYGG